MQYKIVVDKQPRANPSADKEEYVIDIEELRRKGTVYDSLNITLDRTYVIRRLSLSEYGILSELDEPITEELEEVNVELFEGDNYIYLFDMSGNHFYAEYIVKNDFTDTYVTVNRMTSAINETASSIELSVNQKLEGYSTTEEMNTAIELNSSTIMLEVNKKVGEDEFGTLVEQNWEHVKIAWNQISQFIQLEGDNGDATMAFYDNNTKFAEMGVNTVDEDRYISFAIPCDYGEDIADGMAWGIQTTSDNKFWPILYIKNFHMANQSAGDFSGELVLTACNLTLEGINSSIICGNVKMTTAGVFGGIEYLDQENGNNLLSITPQTSIENAKVDILDKISFYKNQAGSNSLRIGLTTENYCLFTDEGYFTCSELSADEISCTNQLSVLGHIYCNNGVEPFSQAEKKKNIEKYNQKALDEVLNTDIYYYNYKEDDENIKRRIGAIIGTDYRCSKEIIGTEGKGINIYSMISLAYKAIQEQQEQIEKITKVLEVKG